MIEQSFSLIPFSKSNIPAIDISGHVRRQNGQLNIQYRLSGEIEKIALPERSVMPQRKYGLWMATCFEFFLAFPQKPQYWEFNVSPSGDWNVFHMESYRRVGFREEISLQRLPSDVRHEADHIFLSVEVDLNALTSADQPLQLGIASVIHSVEQHETYWALAHPTSDPDFHVRDSFLLHI